MVQPGFAALAAGAVAQSGAKGAVRPADDWPKPGFQAVAKAGPGRGYADDADALCAVGIADPWTVWFSVVGHEHIEPTMLQSLQK